MKADFKNLINKYIDQAPTSNPMKNSSDKQTILNNTKNKTLIPINALMDKHFKKYIKKATAAAVPIKKDTYTLAVIDIVFHIPKKYNIDSIEIFHVPKDTYSPTPLSISDYIKRESLFGHWTTLSSPFFPRYCYPTGVMCYIPNEFLMSPSILMIKITLICNGILYYLYNLTEAENPYSLCTPISLNTDKVYLLGIQSVIDLKNLTDKANTEHDRAYFVSELSKSNYNIFPIAGNKTDTSDFSLQYKNNTYFPTYKNCPLTSFSERGSSIYIFHDIILSELSNN